MISQFQLNESSKLESNESITKIATPTLANKIKTLQAIENFLENIQFPSHNSIERQEIYLYFLSSICALRLASIFWPISLCKSFKVSSKLCSSCFSFGLKLIFPLLLLLLSSLIKTYKVSGSRSDIIGHSIVNRGENNAKFRHQNASKSDQIKAPATCTWRAPKCPKVCLSFSIYVAGRYSKLFKQT